jgi:hypothetical protein
MPRVDRAELWLLALLVVFVAGLTLSAVPAPFSIDDCNYLTSTIALKHGQLSVPGTEDLTPSRELLAFDPWRRYRIVTSSPVAPVVPPLYAPVALPFYFLGWRGLVLLNALGVALTLAATYSLVRELSGARAPALLSALTLMVGGYVLEYGQGLWPHGLSLALATWGYVFAFRARRRDSLPYAAVAGVLLAWASGVRYQNAVFLAAIGLTLVLWHPRRVKAGSAFIVGAAPVFLTTSLINHARIGSYNPLSKGAQYLTDLTRGDASSRLSDSLLALYARVVDYSANPAFVGEASAQLLPKSLHRGAFIVFGAVKKAWLQSSPWLSVVLVALVLSWVGRRALFPRGAASVSREREEGVVRELRALSIPVCVMLLLFAWSGTNRHEGWSFNQRYFLELVPLCAMALGLSFSMRLPSWAALGAGGALGVGLAVPPLLLSSQAPMRVDALLFVPLLLAAVFALVWALGTRLPRLRRFDGLLLGMTLGWACAVHLGDDVRAANSRRSDNRTWLDAGRQAVVGERVALVAGPGTRDALCGLHVERDLVLVDPTADGAEDMQLLVDELLDDGRRVYVSDGAPFIVRGMIEDEHPTRTALPPPRSFIEVKPKAP